MRCRCDQNIAGRFGGGVGGFLTLNLECVRLTRGLTAETDSMHVRDRLGVLHLITDVYIAVVTAIGWGGGEGGVCGWGWEGGGWFWYTGRGLVSSH